MQLLQIVYKPHTCLCREMVARAIHDFMRLVRQLPAESGTETTFLERTIETLMRLQAYFSTVVTCSGHDVKHEADRAGRIWLRLYHDMFVSFPLKDYCQLTACIRMFIKLWCYEHLSISFLNISDAFYSVEPSRADAVQVYIIYIKNSRVCFLDVVTKTYFCRA